MQKIIKINACYICDSYHNQNQREQLGCPWPDSKKRNENIKIVNQLTDIHPDCQLEDYNKSKMVDVTTVDDQTIVFN